MQRGLQSQQSHSCFLDSFGSLALLLAMLRANIRTKTAQEKSPGWATAGPFSETDRRAGSLPMLRRNSTKVALSL
jgi:hypothetical protein